VRLTTDVLQRMREAARATDRSLGGMLRHAVRTYAEQQATADTPTDAVAAGDR
jgi:predicted transcriptional regulator